MIRTTVPVSRPAPHTKHWWSNDLMELKKAKNTLSGVSYRFSMVSDHSLHEQHRAIRNKYGDAITKAKQEHWWDFLESGTYENLWLANRYLTGVDNDGGITRIPTLKLAAMESLSGLLGEAATHEDKSKVLERLMFPRKLMGRLTLLHCDYPTGLPVRG